jgi:hypothetical protein
MLGALPAFHILNGRNYIFIPWVADQSAQLWVEPCLQTGNASGTAAWLGNRLQATLDLTMLSAFILDRNRLCALLHDPDQAV